MFLKTAVSFSSLVASAMIVVAVPAGRVGRMERPTTEIAMAGMRYPLPETRPEMIPSPMEVPRPLGRPSLELAAAGTQEAPRGSLAMIRTDMFPAPAEFPMPAPLYEPPRAAEPMAAPEVVPERAEVMAPPPVPIMNSGYIEGFFPGAFVSGVGGRGHSIGYARPESNVRSPGRVYVAGRGVAAPERISGLRLASPGSDVRGQGIREAGALTRPRIEFTGTRHMRP